MMKMKIDEAAFKASGLTFELDNPKHGTFTFANTITHHGTPLTVGVQVVDDELWFFPERSAGQRQVVASLGRPYVAPEIVEHEYIDVGDPNEE
jgi:hypothetical protein